jgi:hypothetical protein
MSRNVYHQEVAKVWNFQNAYNDKRKDGSRRLSYVTPFEEIDPDDRAAIKFNLIRALQHANLMGEVAWIESVTDHGYCWKLTIQVPA